MNWIRLVSVFKMAVTLSRMFCKYAATKLSVFHHVSERVCVEFGDISKLQELHHDKILKADSLSIIIRAFWQLTTFVSIVFIWMGE